MMIGALNNSGYTNNFNIYNKPSSAVDEKVENNKLRINKEDDSKKEKNGRVSPEECETCKNRKYRDGSNEENVSFKSAAHISPEFAGSAVRSHESEHVKNAYNNAEKDNGRVISASVSIQTAVCPECGRTYVSGGTTNTQIKYFNESNPYQKSMKSSDSIKYRGANVDYVA